MTYCVAIELNEGMVFLSDCRTHAGVDNIASFRKMMVWQTDDRALVLLTAGNLAISQSVTNLLTQGLGEGGKDNLTGTPGMFEAARLVGAAVREVYRIDGEALHAQGNEFNVSFVLGGQIGKAAPRLFQIYAAGNFIEATPDTPYFQIGETKYGKPILDRIIRPETTLKAAAKCALISMDSTLRSNLTVGLPIDLAIYRRGALKLELLRHIDDSDVYFQKLGQRWMEGLLSVFKQLPDPDWLQ
jgi:putative proteasome-type protease